MAGRGDRVGQGGRRRGRGGVGGCGVRSVGDWVTRDSLSPKSASQDQPSPARPVRHLHASGTRSSVAWTGRSFRTHSGRSGGWSGWLGRCWGPTDGDMLQTRVIPIAPKTTLGLDIGANWLYPCTTAIARCPGRPRQGTSALRAYEQEGGLV